MDYLYIIIPAAFLLLVLILIIIFHFRKKTVIKKVKALSLTEKSAILNKLAEPAGYTYDPWQGLFTTRLDASQKVFGYANLYNVWAAYFNMVFDYETIYFDYNNRTWLIEMWKGQYGINSGCELGIYYADKIISPDKYNSTIFKAVDAKDMLDITLKLNNCCHNRRNCKYTKLGFIKKKHWWLTIFKMGTFSRPDELYVNTSITFKDYGMLFSFLNSFKSTLPDTTYKINGLTIYFTFCRSRRKYSIFRRIIRHMALTSCHIYCKWFNYITRPFLSAGDRLLYIYLYLPWSMRFLIKSKRKQ